MKYSVSFNNNKMGPIFQYRSFKSDLYSKTSPVRLDYIRDIGGFFVLYRTYRKDKSTSRTGKGKK